MKSEGREQGREDSHVIFLLPTFWNKTHLNNSTDGTKQMRVSVFHNADNFYQSLKSLASAAFLATFL